MRLEECAYPWFDMQLLYDHQVRCCCYSAEKGASFENDSIEDIALHWNSSAMEVIRRTVLYSTLSLSPCRNCQYLKLGDPDRYKNIPIGINRLQKENWERALSHFKQKDIILKSAPVNYYLNFGLSCNLNCIMCSQKNLRRRERRELSPYVLDKVKEQLVKACSVTVIGGEPLFMRSSMTFIDRFIHNKMYKDVELRIVTNGTLIDERFDLLVQKEKLSLSVSLDSIGDTYEKIRKGGDWNSVSKGIERIIDCRNRTKRQWHLHVSMVLMKSSLKKIGDFVQYCTNNELDLSISPIYSVSSREKEQEDVFNNPSLLDDIPGWEGALSRASEALDKSGQSAAATKLREMNHRLALAHKNKELFGKKADGYFVHHLIDSVDAPFVIWGTGSHYTNVVKKYFEDLKFDNFIGFIDNDPEKVGKMLDGYQIYGPDDLCRLGPASIIISSAFKQEIEVQIKAMGLSFDNIL